MVCVLFGHRDTPDVMRGALKAEIKRIISEFPEVEFYVGNNGGFDAMAQGILKELANHCSLRFSVVLSRVDEVALCKDNSVTLFPDGQERALKRFAMVKRNMWMLGRSNMAICYVSNRITNSYRMLEKARRMGLPIINIANWRED